MNVAVIKEILSKPLSEIESNPTEAGALVRFYRYVYPELSICSGCWKDIYNKLKSQDFTKFENMANCSYKLKDGITVPMRFGSAQHISNLNLTDELAEEFLRINENRINLFTKFPKDWKKRVSGEKQEQPKEQPAKPARRQRIRKK